MTESNHVCDLWEHTIAKFFKHDPKSELGLMLKEWDIFNNYKNFNSFLNHTIDDFTSSGNLSYINKNPDILHQTPMHEVLNLRWYIQHLMDENEDEPENPLSEQKFDKTIKLEIHQLCYSSSAFYDSRTTQTESFQRNYQETT